MVFKGNLDIDKRGLIYEAYRIEGIGQGECRSIFMDWALGAPSGDVKLHIQTLLDAYGTEAPDHPMTAVLREGLGDAKGHGTRRGGRAGRVHRNQP